MEVYQQDINMGTSDDDQEQEQEQDVGVTFDASASASDGLDIISLEEVCLFRRGDLASARPQFVYEGRIFVFSKYRVKSDGQKVEDYRCRQCRRKTLMVTAHLEGSSQRLLLSEQGAHLYDCLETPQELQRLQLRQAMISEARDIQFGVVRPSLRSIFEKVRRQVPEGKQKQLGAFTGANRRLLQRARQSAFPPLPIDLLSFHRIPEELTLLDPSGESFVLFFVDYLEDDGSYGTLLAFGTKQSCVLLSQATRIFCDATFKIVPHPFYQCFSISTLFGLPDNKMTCPRIFVLFSHKKETMYTCLLQYLMAKFAEFDITSNAIVWRQATVDFESAQRNAVNVLSHTLLDGIVSNNRNLFLACYIIVFVLLYFN